MSRFAQFRAAARLIARGYAARGRLPATASHPRQAAERAGIRADPRRLHRYLRATGGDGLRGQVLPPLYPCTWETLLALELLSTLEPPLPFGAVIHTGSEILIPRPATPGDPLRCRVELARREPARDGVKLEVAASNRAAAGQLCTESRHFFRIRTGSGPRAPAEPFSLDGWRQLADWPLPSGAGRRYARASGDWNPIHLWGWTARPMGFRQPILHGFCTAAMVAHRLCDQLWAGEAAALRRFQVAFRAPLALPGRAALWIRPDGGGHAFRVTDAEGARLFAEGACGGGVPPRNPADPLP